MLKNIIQENSCGCSNAAMKKELNIDIKNMAEGEPIPSSRNCKAVPTITAIIISA